MLTRPILVAYASRHHGTEEMATEIAAALREAGFSVDLRAAAEVSTTEPYGAVVVGSAVYLTEWERPALELIQRKRDVLAGRRVWLFSSGPVGNGRATRHPESVPQPAVVDRLADEIGVRASIWSSDFIVGAGAPGGVSDPWGKAEGRRRQEENKAQSNARRRRDIFIGEAVSRILPKRAAV